MPISLYVPACGTSQGQGSCFAGLFLTFACQLRRLLMITWHLGLFVTLTLGQIGFQGRKQGYF